MNAIFVELPPFQRYREHYISDANLRVLQALLLQRPDAGDVIPETGGLRKLRFGDPRRGKGKRGGLRVIYYWWVAGDQIWLFTLYGKDEADDLTVQQRRTLAHLLLRERQLRAI